VTRNPEYYALAHVSRFVRPGSWRIAASSAAKEIETVGFANPGGTIVLVAFNAAQNPVDFDVDADGRHISYRLPASAAATFRWRR
jgi:glucosylceramidase